MSIIPYSTGIYPHYRFYITYSTLSYEVFPLKFNDSSLTDELAGNEVFYRRKFNGSLLFGTNSTVLDEDGNIQNRMDDWLLFWAFEITNSCDKLYLTITKNSITVPYLDSEIYWEGYFSTNEGKFDIDRCTFEVTPIVNDDYTLILEKTDIQHNMLSAGAAVSTEATGFITETYTRNRWLTDLVDYLADFIKAGCSTSYTFFTDTPNYVTLDANHLTLLTIAQKSDIKYPASTDPSTTALISWKELMDILWGMFQMKWNYDSTTDTINVEHISWVGFSPSPGLDLRSHLTTVATNKYTYLKNDMPKYEYHSFAEANNTNFLRMALWYDSPCVNQDMKSNIVETSINVTTDLEYIYNNPDDISSDGWVIFCNYSEGGSYYIEYQSGKYITTDFKLNMRLSWANLFDSYFRHNRVLLEGYLNNALVTFWTAQKIKQQECSVVLCADYDPAEEITTELGETYFGGAKARVKSANIKPSGEVKFNLIYGPEDNVNTGVADIKIVYLYQTDECMVFNVFLTVTPTVAITLSIRAIITYDRNPLTTCTTDWQDFTWNPGDHTDTITIINGLCDAFNPATDCVTFEWDDSALLDFTYEAFPYDSGGGVYPCGC